MRLPLYLYSTKNFVGSGLAIGAAGLYLTGIIQDFWWIIVMASYGVGAIAAPGSPSIDVQMRKQMDDAEIIEGLNTIAVRAPQVLPEAVASNVVEICENLKTLIPALTRSGAGGSVAYDVRTAATEYLPQTLEAYLKLPRAFRATAKSADGKNADEMLTEQVATLRKRLDDVTTAVASADAAALSENGRFLRERFAQGDFTKAL